MLERFIVILAILTCPLLQANATQAPGGATQASGAHDFDWEIGTWDTALKRRPPLSGKAEWDEYSGTSTVKPVMKGRANLVELDVQGAAGHIDAISLRLFEPASGQWTLNFANLANGAMTDAMAGAFHHGRGTFYGLDTVHGRKVLVRFLITPAAKDQWRFEQAYSADGGQNWETNWIAVDTRRTASVER
jgi:hypothetical protein